MDWEMFIPVDAVVCGLVILVLAIAAYRFRNRVAASGPVSGLFFLLLAVPILAALARLDRFSAEAEFWQTVAIEAYAMFLGMVLPVAVVLVVMERSRRRWEIRRIQEELGDLRGWNHPGASRRIQNLLRRLNRFDVTGIDLSRCRLRRLNLNGMNLAAVRMVGADLEGANLSESNLAGGDLQGAGLRRAVLRKTNLRRAVLWGADLREANLSEADLHGALLKEADFSGADLGRARLEGAKGLSLAQLSRARTLHKAKLSPALLSKIKEVHPALLRAP